MKDYQSIKLFIGNSTFGKFQSCNKHLSICYNIQLHLNYKNNVIFQDDPLWHSKPILNFVNKGFTNFIYCTSVLSFDKLTLAGKAYIRVKTFLLNKLDLYSRQFYGLSEATLNYVPYLFSFINNRVGDQSRLSVIEKYLVQYYKLYILYQKCIYDKNIINPKSATILQALQIV